MDILFHLHLSIQICNNELSTLKKIAVSNTMHFCHKITLFHLQTTSFTMGKTNSGTKAPRKEGRINRAPHSMNPDRPTEGLKGVAKARTKATIKRLQMYRCFKAKRNRKGKRNKYLMNMVCIIHTY